MKLRWIFVLAFGANAALTIIGLGVLARSPYTGLRLAVKNGEATVMHVDRGSPADGKIRVNDRLLDVDDLGISPSVFSADPDYLGTRKGLNAFWESERNLAGTISKGKTVTLAIGRNGGTARMELVPGNFPARVILQRAGPILAAGWLYFLIGYLTLRKKTVEMSAANFINAASICACFAALAVFSSRDLALSYGPFRALYAINVVTALLFSVAFLHLMLVFPARKRSLEAIPWLPWGLYGLGCLAAGLHLSGFHENIFLTSYLPVIACTAILQAMLIYDYFTEKSTVHKKQIQWVVLGGGFAVVLWGGLTAIPMMFGESFVSQDVSLLFTLFYPVGLAFAITKYRLMDIESIFDHSIIYGATILTLAGLELGFLGFIAPIMTRQGLDTALISLAAAVVIVFVYSPVRAAVQALVERLFKRGTYDVNAESERFYVTLGVQDGRTMVEKFAAFAAGLLASSGVIMAKTDGSGGAELLYADDGAAKDLSSEFLRIAPALWRGLGNGKLSRFGYEAVDAAQPCAPGPASEFERSLFVSFPIEEQQRAAGYLAVLLRKWNDIPYSKKDEALMNAVAMNISGIIKSEELQREKSAMEAAFKKQRDDIAREMHDGLGNILTTIAVSAQVAERHFPLAPDRTEALLGLIEEHSREALDFMRTGLTVLDNPDAGLNELAARVQERYEDVLWADNARLQTDVEEAVRDYRPGAAASIAILRIIQEALSNVMKHARAKTVTIGFRERDGELLVMVRDDGRGFGHATSSPGMGLANMDKRARALGGQLAVTSSPGGTEIRFCLPIRGREK